MYITMFCVNRLRGISMRHVFCGIAVLMLACLNTASAQTPEIGLNDTPLTRPEMPLRISVAPSGMSLVSTYLYKNPRKDTAWSRFLSPAGVPIGVEGDAAGRFNIQSALSDDRWAFLEQRDSVMDLIYPRSHFVSKYYFRISDLVQVIDSTDTLFAAGGRHVIIADEGGITRGIRSVQSVRSGESILLCADVSVSDITPGGTRPAVGYMEHQWACLGPGDTLYRYTTDESEAWTDKSPGTEHFTDILVGGIAPSGARYLVRRERLSFYSSENLLTRLRLDPQTGDVADEHILDTLIGDQMEAFNSIIAYDDGALDIPMLLPGSDSLAVRRYDASGAFRDQILICSDVRVYSSYDRVYPDARILKLSAGRTLVAWSRPESSGRRWLYLSFFDTDWQLIGTHHPIGTSVERDQIFHAIAIHNDTLAVAWFDNRDGEWAVRYQRLPLEQFIPSEPPVQVVLFTHIEDNLPQADLHTPEARAQYMRMRDACVAFANRTAAHGISWSLQPDWKFLLAALRFEPGLDSPETGGKPLLTWLRDDRGVAIDPHSHEKQGYNYTDVAHLLDSLGVGGSTVIGGHIWDPELPQFQQWDRFRTAQPGSRFPWASWRGDILMGSGTPNHVNDPVVSGVWRPADRWHFFDHDPAGNIRCVGQYTGDMTGLAELVSLRRSAAIPPDSMLTLSIHIPPADLLMPGGMNAVEDTVLAPLAEMRNRGDVVTTGFAALVDSWEQEYQGQASVYRPGISTGIDTQPAQPGREAMILDIAPHPVSGRATVRYALKKAAFARVELFNALGKRVAVITAQESGPGVHHAGISAQRLPSGVYFLRLTAGSSVHSRPFVVQ